MNSSTKATPAPNKPIPAAFPMVYRHGDRPDLQGRLCRIVRYGERQFWRDGSPKMGTMGESVAVEFEDGTRVEVMRNAVIRARSRRGRRHVRLDAARVGG